MLFFKFFQVRFHEVVDDQLERGDARYDEYLVRGLDVEELENLQEKDGRETDGNRVAEVQLGVFVPIIHVAVYYKIIHGLDE